VSLAKVHSPDDAIGRSIQDAPSALAWLPSVNDRNLVDQLGDCLSSRHFQFGGEHGIAAATRAGWS
jgi:hypothetical protein